MSYSLSNGNSKYLSPTTSIALTDYYGYGSGNDHGNVTLTSIILKDISTNSALTTSTPPSPSIIVAQAVFRND
jgi:hypothetical protein